MKKLFFLLTVLALTVNAVYAQKLKKAYDQLHAGEYEDAESMFNKAISKNMESGVA